MPINYLLTYSNNFFFLQFAIGSLMDDYLGKYSTKHFSTEVIGLMDTTFLDFNKGLNFLLGFVDSLVSALNGQLLLKQTIA